MSNCRVYIGQLPNSARERDVERFFKGYGKIREVVLKNGYGFIEFDEYRDAEDAVHDLNGKELCGDRIVLEYARPAGSSRGRSRGGGGGGGGFRGSFRMERYGFSRAPPSSFSKGDNYQNRPPRRPPPMRTDYRVLVENLSSRISWQELKDFMRKAGEVTYADAHKIRRNEGVVEFASLSDMKAALEQLDGKELNGRAIKLTEDKNSSRSRNRRSRSRSSSRSYSRSRSSSRSHSRRDKRSRSKDRRSRSKDRRSRSKDRRSHSKDSRSRSKDRRSRSKDRRSRSKDRRSRSKDRRSRSKDRRSRSKDRKSGSKERRSRSKDRSRSRDGSKEKKEDSKNRNGSGRDKHSRSASRSESDGERMEKRSRSSEQREEKGKEEVRGDYNGERGVDSGEKMGVDYGEGEGVTENRDGQQGHTAMEFQNSLPGVNNDASSNEEEAQ